MANLRSDADADQIMRLLYGGLKFTFLQQAVELDVFKTIYELNDSVTIRQYAEKKNYDVRVLEKLLDFLVCVGLLKKSRSHDRDHDPYEKYTYSNSGATKKFLFGSAPGTMSPMVPFIAYICRKIQCDFQSVLSKGIKSAWYTDDLVNTVLDHVQVGTAQNGTKQQFSAEEFGLVMDGFTSTCVDAIVGAFDLSSHRVAVDVGGGFGFLAEALARRYPEMTVCVFDQQHITEMATRVKKDIKIKMISGDFFKDELPEADLYIMCHVVENWTDSNNHFLLEKAYSRLPEGGQLLLVEKFLSEDKTEPENPVIGNIFASAMDLEGDYRTEEEYSRLLEKEGFVSIQCRRIEGYNDHDVMLATKPYQKKTNHLITQLG